MATTTNYAWETPDDTDLVKDGAAAIRTLGSSVDTTTKALNPSTTLGDIEYRSATANTNTRLGIGTTGQVLTVAGGVPSWATPPVAGGMTLLSTTTLSGTSTTISGINQTYKDLLIQVCAITTSTNGKDIRCGMNGSSGGMVGFLSNIQASTTQGVVSTQQSLMDQSRSLIAAAGTNAWVLRIADYASTNNIKNAQLNGAYLINSETHVIIGNNTSGSTAAVTSMYFECPQSFTGGEVKIWGIN